MGAERPSPKSYIGARLELPISRTTFQLPSFCFFQMLVYLPYSTVAFPSLFFEWNS